MDEIQSVITFLENEVSWLAEQKQDTDTILGEVYKEIDGDKRVQIMQAAIFALQELEQYRATGLTPRMIEELKDNDKKSHKLAVKRAADLDEYQAIGTPEECREAREKQNKKKPHYEGDGYADGELVYDTWVCPCCGNCFEVDYDECDYCPNCGQHIDWGENDA